MLTSCWLAAVTPMCVAYVHTHMAVHIYIVYIRNVLEDEVVVTDSANVLFFAYIPGTIFMMCRTWYRLCGGA